MDLFARIIMILCLMMGIIAWVLAFVCGIPSLLISGSLNLALGVLLYDQSRNN